MPTLTNETLALLMKVLGGIAPEDADTFPLLRDFWEHLLFKWSLPPWLIEYVKDHRFNWVRIIRDLSEGLATKMHGSFAYHLPRDEQQVVLKKLLEMALVESPDRRARSTLEGAAERDGIVLSRGSVAVGEEVVERLAEKNDKALPSDPKRVMVIHGRDERVRNGIFAFLRSLDLSPIEWSQAVELTGRPAPYVGQILEAAFSHAQAVVAVFTPDELVQLRTDLRSTNDPPHELGAGYQARANVLFESGMAVASHPDRTVFVEFGTLRPFSDIGGRHTVRMDNSVRKRQEFAQRLVSAGCPVNMSGTDWHIAGDLTPPDIPSTTPPEQAERTHTKTEEPESTHLADLISELEDNLHKAKGPRVGHTYRRPSTQTWTNVRNKLNLRADLRSNLETAYRQIDNWENIAESGINPNVGSQELNIVTSNLAFSLPNLIAELKKVQASGRR